MTHTETCGPGCSHDHAHADATTTQPDEQVCGCGHDHCPSSPVDPASAAATDTVSAQTAYDVAVDNYIGAYMALLGHLKQDEKPTPDQQRPFVQKLVDTETAADEALKRLLTEHPHGELTQRYVTASFALFVHVGQLAHNGLSPMAARYRGETKRLFDAFRDAERAYAEHYRTISNDGWLLALPVEKKLHRSIHGLLFTKRTAEEKPVLHALKLLEMHPSLRIPAPGSNKEKKRRKAGRDNRR